METGKLADLPFGPVRQTNPIQALCNREIDLLNIIAQASRRDKRIVVQVQKHPEKPKNGVLVA